MCLLQIAIVRVTDCHDLFSFTAFSPFGMILVPYKSVCIVNKKQISRKVLAYILYILYALS